MFINFKIISNLEFPIDLKIQSALFLALFISVIYIGICVGKLQNDFFSLRRSHQDYILQIKAINKKIDLLSQALNPISLFKQYAYYKDKVKYMTPQRLISRLEKSAKQANFYIQSIHSNAIEQQNNFQIDCWEIDLIGNFINFINFFDVLISDIHAEAMGVRKIEIQKHTINSTQEASDLLDLKITFAFYSDMDNLDKIFSSILEDKKHSMANGIIGFGSMYDKENLNHIENSKLLKSTISKYIYDPFFVNKYDSTFFQSLGLNYWPIARLRLVGFLQQNIFKLGIVADPNDNLYQIHIGDKIAREQKIVTDFKEGEILIK